MPVIIVRWRNWKESAVPQMSVPSPLTVQTPLLKVALPAAPTDPISVECQKSRSACAAAGAATVSAARTVKKTPRTNESMCVRMLASLVDGMHEHGFRRAAWVVTGHGVPLAWVGHWHVHGPQAQRRRRVAAS